LYIIYNNLIFTKFYVGPLVGTSEL